MRFTLVYQGRIPTSGSLEQVSAIRLDKYLQSQLEALYKVTGTKYASENRLIVGDTRYTAILPISWVCSLELVLLRATPHSQISGLPDIDNTLKTLFDALCAPAGATKPPGSPTSKACYVVALEDKQFSSISVSADHHWSAKSEDDLVLVRVSMQETELDDAVSLGGQSFKTVRRHVH
jgi:hypothetical protein